VKYLISGNRWQPIQRQIPIRNVRASPQPAAIIAEYEVAKSNVSVVVHHEKLGMVSLVAAS
jgi:hypothetical protein